MPELKRAIFGFAVAVLLGFLATHLPCEARNNQRPNAETCVPAAQESDLTWLTPARPVKSVSVCRVLNRIYEIVRAWERLVFQVFRLICELTRE